MKYGLIGTWRMSYESIKNNTHLLKEGDPKGDAIVNAIAAIEDFPYFKSVGFGGLPNEKGEVELDAAFMNGQTLQIGALAGVKDVKNPIKVAQKLSTEKFNNLLVAEGAKEYAKNNSFEIENMLSDRAIKHYEKKLQLLKSNPELSPYDGHDTVGMVSLDAKGNMFSATSTSGLFFKKPGRVGDSPIAGAGYYCDNEIGGATATGLGEDIMKGCLSFQTVMLMKSGLSPMKAAQKVVSDFDKYLTKKLGKCGAISIVALDKDGNYGIGTNCDFSFVVETQKQDSKIFLAVPNPKNKTVVITEASKEWLENYDKSRRGPID